MKNQNSQNYKKFYKTLGYPNLKQCNPEFIERLNTIQDQKLEIIKSKLKILKSLPFIDSVYLSGSVGFGFPKESSDLDLFIVTKKNKIWSTRFFSHLVLRFLKLSRRDGDKNTKDKFCLNHFITTESMESSSKNIFQAFKYSHLIKIFASPKTEKLLFDKNKTWIKNYIPNYDKSFMSDYTKSVFSEKSQKIILEIQSSTKNTNFVKFLLQLSLFCLEPITKLIQARKIKSNPNFNPENIKISDKELKFHPKNKENSLINHLFDIV